MRLSNRGIVDRGRALSFTFDGRSFTGFAGDTLASALLGAGERMMARSFKYHRPRGPLTAGSDEPSALVTVGSGGAEVPNVRATMQEIYPGLEARSQNAWPSLGFDLLGVNDWLSPFLGAGFYYKTFMWPRKFWERLYEPVIRRAAGLGALPGTPASEPYEKAFAFCDLLVIGGGPAGLTAALLAGRAGADVILADEDHLFGGRLLGEAETIDGAPARDWAARVTAELMEMPNVRLMPRTTVTGAYDGGTYGALERVSLHRGPAPGAPMECFWRIVAERAILCTGALERHVAFPGNDRPGVMLAGATRTYLHRYGVTAGPRVAVFGANDDAWRTAYDLHAAGVKVTALIDARPDSAPPEAPFPVHVGAEVVATSGRSGLHEIRIRKDGKTFEAEADCLAVSGGWNPNLALTCHLGSRPEWNPALHAFLARPGAVPGMDVAGAAAGVFSTRGAMKSAQFRVKAALEALGRKLPGWTPPEAGEGDPRLAPLWAVEAKGRAWLDLQNDVTTKDIKLAAREGYSAPEHMKRYTTQGMATDQGKSSNLAALAVLADATGGALPGTGTTTFRPPYVPISIAALGAGGRGMGFAPQRFTTSHAAALERGAPMVEAGLWYRPSYFPRPGETTWRESCDREVRMVRETVGVADVSTLGKIDLQGPDGADFLDLVYTNLMSSLPVGKTRYGLMLREDGTVMDDGTCARLGETHWLITTTTAAAGPVMKHLDFAQQAHMPDGRFRFASVTEQWAQFCLAGPKALELLNLVVDAPVSDAEMPFMGCAPLKVGGVAGRLFRISFSGERGYEIAVPARWGAALWRILVAQAEALGGGPYGLEALNVLRIEKGFLTHAEIHGRVTAADVGLGGMVSGRKDCIGKTLAARPGLTGEREELVGLRAVGGAMQLTAGAGLFRLKDPATRIHADGYTTSACFSPTLGGPLALGFLRDGRARHGEQLRVVDHLRGIETLAEVCPPCFHDPDGGRMR